MSYIFDGDSKIISLIAGTTILNVRDLYSRWKDWVSQSNNSRYDLAFTNSVGGESLGDGQFIGSYYFLQNNWLIRPQEADHTLLVDGNLFLDPEGSSTALFINTIGDFQVNIQLRTSSLTQALETSGTSLWTIGQINALLNDVQLLKRVLTNRTRLDTNTNELVTYQEDGVTELYRQNTFDSAGNPSSTDIFEIGEIEDA